MSLNDWKNEIIKISEFLDSEIDYINEQNKFNFFSNTLKRLRDLVEAIASFIYTTVTDKTCNFEYDTIKAALKFCAQNPKYEYLFQFHNLLQVTSSHYSIFGESAERILYSFTEFLYRIKNGLEHEFGIKVLSNINKIPYDDDKNFEEYYCKVNEAVELNKNEKSETGLFYVQNKRIIHFEKFLLYEYTLNEALANASKYDRFIAYSKIDIFENYAIRCNIKDCNIEFFDSKLPIKIICEYWVSIRPCELKNFGRIFGHDLSISKDKRYFELMSYIKDNRISLDRILSMPVDIFQTFLDTVFPKGAKVPIKTILLSANQFLQNKSPGYNTILYLACIMNNVVIKNQLSIYKNSKISDLFLQAGVLVFDNTPFSGSLIKHNPRFNVLIKLFDCSEFSDDIFANHIINKSNHDSCIYIKYNKAKSKDVSKLIDSYNERISYKKKDRQVCSFGNNLYIAANENNSVEIINKLIEKSKNNNFPSYSSYVEKFLNQKSIVFNDEEQEHIFKNMFNKTDLYCLYGAAGTGKSTLIAKILLLFSGYSIICLTNTHTALENLKEKITVGRIDFTTVKSFISPNYKKDIQYDIAVIDECSCISSRDMLSLLSKIKTTLMILSGDIYQLPAIQFGNWFSLLQQFLPKSNKSELSKVHRCESNQRLKELWDLVRSISPSISVHLNKYEFSHIIDKSIFDCDRPDSVTLAYNYNGVYGVNNLNRLLQLKNPNPEYKWKHYTFKIGDPIIFNDNIPSNKFIYNNLKGTIRKIEITTYNIQFWIQIHKVLNTGICYLQYFFNVEKVLPCGDSIIKIIVSNCSENDYDNDEQNSEELKKIPFDIAYAISIHKAQGLEFNNVNLVITEDDEESISYNVFYTAITRAKQNLKIFWSKSTEQKIIKNFNQNNVTKDFNILKNKLSKKTD